MEFIYFKNLWNMKDIKKYFIRYWDSTCTGTSKTFKYFLRRTKLRHIVHKSTLVCCGIDYSETLSQLKFSTPKIFFYIIKCFMIKFSNLLLALGGFCGWTEAIQSLQQYNTFNFDSSITAHKNNFICLSYLLSHNDLPSFINTVFV